MPNRARRDLVGGPSGRAVRRTGARLALAGALVGVVVLPVAFPSTAHAHGRPLPPTVWGVTLDDTAGITQETLGQEVDSLAALPTVPMASVVMDVGTRPAAYATAVNALRPVSYLMAELGDSSEMRRQSVASYQHFESSLVTAYADSIDLWEVGNEVNGEWVGSTRQEVAKISDAYNSVQAVGGATALTLYYNPDCWTKRSHEMVPWAEANIPAAMKSGLDYVLISYYPDECNNYWPTQAGWQSVFDQLHAVFPHAALGFGESGISSDAGSAAAKASLLSKYYTLSISGDNYVGGYFWWYYAEDAVPYQGNAVWDALRSAMDGEGAPAATTVGPRLATARTEGWPVMTPAVVRTRRCRRPIEITGMTFVPSTVKAGRSSVLHLSARNCVDQSRATDLTMTGTFSGSHRTGCPIIDPLIRRISFPADGTVRSHVTYHLPPACAASRLRVTATFTSSDRSTLIRRSTSLSIT